MVERSVRKILPKKEKKRILKTVSLDSHSTGTEIDTSHLHFFCVRRVRVASDRCGDLRRLERFWSTIHNSEIEITFEKKM